MTGKKRENMIVVEHKWNEEELKQLREMAEQGDAKSQCLLGIVYFQGGGVPKNYAEAVRWFRLAAEQGCASAQFNIGYMYSRGYGVPRDKSEAAKWCSMAAEQGDSFAQRELGFMYDEGRGVPQDETEAIKWFSKSIVSRYLKLAKSGEADAQYNVADERGTDTLQRLAESNKTDAQYNLGLLYLEGKGVQQDEAEAAKWLRLAAEQGHTEAKEYLQKAGLAGA